MAIQGVVAAGHPQTAQAAQEILLAGGNAFDAALAGMCVACATEPMLCSLGGGGYLLARPGRGAPVAYDFFVHTPLEPTNDESDFREVFCDFGAVRQAFHIGLGSIATPGVVRGLFTIHRDLGSMPIRDVMAPAIAIAKEGVEISALHAYVFRVVESIFTATEAARAIYSSPNEPSRLIGEGELDKNFVFAEDNLNETRAQLQAMKDNQKDPPPPAVKLALEKLISGLDLTKEGMAGVRSAWGDFLTLQVDIGQGVLNPAHGEGRTPQAVQLLVSIEPPRENAAEANFDNYWAVAGILKSRFAEPVTATDADAVRTHG
ncbi:MAG: gamma-glutamyltransferase [Acidobacteria bacterium]|nr:gamma-glutamyltransferase [Acidobacteriota bacterium]